MSPRSRKFSVHDWISEFDEVSDDMACPSFHTAVVRRLLQPLSSASTRRACDYLYTGAARVPAVKRANPITKVTARGNCREQTSKYPVYLAVSNEHTDLVQDICICIFVHRPEV
jgi:hypothetical protein